MEDEIEELIDQIVGRIDSLVGRVDKLSAVEELEWVKALLEDLV